jgi:hypothetical protein
MKTLVIGDTQIKKGHDFSAIEATANYIVAERPEEIVILGDWFDLASLSKYANARERKDMNLKEDIQAGVEGLRKLLRPLRMLNARQVANKKKLYRPKIVFTMGNHEERMNRFLGDNPHLDGVLFDVKHIVGTFPIDVYDFLEPYTGIRGIKYFHYLANPMSGNAVGGSMENKLNKTTYSFVHGHQQQFQYAERQQVDGKQQLGVCVGAFYEHDEGYKGVQGNTHSRGTVVLHHHDKGSDVEFISCERIKRVYGDK